MSSNPLADAGAVGQVKYFDHIADNVYRAGRITAEQPLLVTSLDALLADVRAGIDASGLLLPDADALIERVVVALLGGHLILAGPPGTGKTTLAGVVSAAFRASYDTETATADWSTFDIIGGLQPAVGQHGTEVLTPWLGHVPRAALRCADAINLHDHDSTANPNQAHWLIIDEFNRAEIDKAIGPLYTVLGRGGGPEHRKLPLWFGDSPETKQCWIPERFRIIGTLNSVDTAYVYSLSQGLQRRFQFVHVGVPEESQLKAEITSVVAQAASWWVDTYRPDLDPDGKEAESKRLHENEHVVLAAARLQDFVAFLRYGDTVAWPVGTAQAVDVIRQVLVRSARGDTSKLIEGLDLALSDCLIPQVGGLLKTQLDAIKSWLVKAGDLPRSESALQRVRHSQQASFG